VVLGWPGTLLRKLRAIHAVREICGPARTLLELSPQLGFARLAIGAPAAAIAVEDLAAWGIQAVAGVGFAAAIAADLAPGDVAVCAAALRAEGTSRHYLPAARFAWPDPHLTGRLRAVLPAVAFGPA
jgi:uridine phosphorylase